MDSKHQSRIQELRHQLLNSGYHAFQVDEMYRETVGSVKIAELDNTKAEQLIEALTDQVEFALKCRAKKSR